MKGRMITMIDLKYNPYLPLIIIGAVALLLLIFLAGAPSRLFAFVLGGLLVYLFLRKTSKC